MMLDTTASDLRTSAQPTASRPLSLSDDQMNTILAMAEPLVPDDRARFLRDVALALQGRELGDGLVARVCAMMQRKYWRAPDLSAGRDYAKHRRR